MTVSFVMPTYARYPLTLVRGFGCRVEDDQGREYLDFVSGIAVNTLGHAHPALQAAIREQAATMLHCSNLFHIPQQERLAERLCRLSGMGSAFFCNSGAEANEAAIKLVRRHFHLQNSPRRNVITAHQSFHGRSLCTLSATGQQKVKTGFDPLPTGFVHVPWNDIAALEAAIDQHTAAVMLEPLQGEGGVHVADAEYLRQVRALCDHHGLLLVFDEVQTGIGRCGSMFAFEQTGIRPDVLTLAKGLGGGVPIGCLLAEARLRDVLSPGTHGSTFGGNPLSCQVAWTVLEVIEEQNLLDNVRRQGARLCRGLEALRARHPQHLRAVRGQGLLWGLVCEGDHAAQWIERARAHGLLLLPAGPDVIRLLPPLNVNDGEVDEALRILNEVFR